MLVQAQGFKGGKTVLETCHPFKVSPLQIWMVQSARWTMAARSFSITVLNWTGRPWTRTNISLPHGEWSNGGALVPPEQIPPVHLNGDGDAAPGLVFFEAESQGFATGTQGSVDYNSQFGKISINFDNPFAGGNSFNTSGPDSLRLLWGDPGGNNASITLEIRKS
jgi:hypothetical protein